MILHIQARPDANPVIYTGSAADIEKRLQQFKRRYYNTGRAPFCVMYDVQVWEGGSHYYIRLQSWGKWQIMERGKYCDSAIGPGYEYFGHAFRRFLNILEAEKEVARYV